MAKSEQDIKQDFYDFLLDSAIDTAAKLRKKEIDNKKFAEMILIYMRKKSLSQKTLAAELGIPKSTLQHWIMYNDVSIRSPLKKSEDLTQLSTDIDQAIYYVVDQMKILSNRRNLVKSNKTAPLLRQVEQFLKVLKDKLKVK